MAVVAVRANPEDGRAHLLEDSQGVAQRAQLTLTDVREVPDVEREDDRSSAERLRERDRLPFVTQHREIGRLLAYLDHRVTSGRRASGVGAITLSLSRLTGPGPTRERNVYLTGAAHQGSTQSTRTLNRTTRATRGKGQGERWRSTCSPPTTH